MLGVPCITLRTSTERQITIIKNTNILTGYNQRKLFMLPKNFITKKLKNINYLEMETLVKKFI